MSCRILIADVDVKWLEICERDLGESGFIVETVPDALACLGRLQRHPLPDALVLELDTPWTGILGWLRAEEQKSVLDRCEIILTGNSPPAFVSQLREIPVSVYLQKPVSGECLRDAIGRRPAFARVLAQQGCRSIAPRPWPWELRVERGPNWLVVTAMRRDEACTVAASLADELWALMEQHFTYRLVLELDRGTTLEDKFLQELISLDNRARAHDGFIRLCGLPKFQRQQLRHRGDSGLYDLLSVYDDVHDAVFGEHPRRLNGRDER